MFNIECFLRSVPRGGVLSSGSQSNRSTGPIFHCGGQASKKISFLRDRFLFLTGPKPTGASPLPISLAEPETSRIDIVDGLPPA